MSVVALAIPLILTGAILIAGKTADFSQLTERLNYDFNVKVFKLNLSGLNITLDFLLDNPTDQNLTISFPFVMIYYDETFVTQNSVINQTYNLRPKSKLTIPDISFRISLFKIASLLSIDSSTLLNAIRTLNFKPYLDILQKKFTSTATFEINKLPITYKDSLFGIGEGKSAINREIKSCPQYDKLFPVPNGSKKMLLKNGSVHDTVRLMHKIVEQDYSLVYEASQKLFKSANVYDTSQKIFDFVFKYIKYNLEEGEQLRNPAVTYHLGQRLAREFYKEHGYFNQEYSADCDDISIFVASILKNLGIKYAFRIASYSSGANYSHVYVIAFDENNKQIIIDPVYYKFNAEKQYYNQKTYDKNMKTLSGIPVYYLNGLGETTESTDNIFEFLKYSRKILSQAAGYRQGAIVMAQMLDYLIKYWNTSKKQEALNVVISKEKQYKNGIYKNSPNERLFFEELQGFSNSGFGKFGDKFKDFVNKEFDKLKKIVPPAPTNIDTTKPITNNISTPNISNANIAPPNYNDDSIKQTLRDIISKYKVPIAVGVFATTSGIVIATSPKIQKKIGLKK